MSLLICLCDVTISMWNDDEFTEITNDERKLNPPPPPHQRVKRRGLGAISDVISVALSAGVRVAVDAELVARGGQQPALVHGAVNRSLGWWRRRRRWRGRCARARLGHGARTRLTARRQRVGGHEELKKGQKSSSS